MNRKQFLIILVLVLVVGGLGLMLYNQRAESFSRSGGSLGGKVLGDFDLNAVAQLVIKQSSNEVTLVKKDDQWRVRERSDYPANFADLSESLRQLADLKFTQRETVGPSNLGRLELIPPGQGTNAAASGTLVELKDKDGKLLRSLLIGKKYSKKPASDDQFGGGGMANGRYVQANGDAKQIGLVSDALSKLEAKPENWINKDFFKLEGPRSFAVVTANDTNWWRLSRTNAAAEWTLINAGAGEKLDQNKVSGLGSFLSFGSFSDVKPLPKDLKEIGLDKPRVVTVETFDDFKYQLKIGGNTNDENLSLQLVVSANLPKERIAGKDEKPEDKEKLDKAFKDRQSKLSEKLANEKVLEGWVFQISKWSLDAVLKDRQELLEEKKEEKKDGAAPDAKPADAK